VRALVTGGASGIGAATVHRLRADGATVAVLDTNAGLLDRSPAEVRLVADVSQEAEVERTVAEAAEALGGLDAVVAGAGILRRGTVAETSVEDWDRVFAVNVRGVFLTARAAIPHLRQAGGGAIVIVASQLSFVGQPANAAYVASKGALTSLARTMAIDHSAEGIRVNAVCPGPTDTPMQDSFGQAAEARAGLARMQLHARLVTPDEVADAIAYLLSPRAASTLGTALVVDGGYTAR
jgi:NAD(P)-dependent dehydrogenase (short-subunit alcohol dehydrogenase family)